MATSTATSRLRKEYKALHASPPPLITAKPLETNILEWHYLLRGPPATPYAGGIYWGTIKFPADYPFRPPSLRMHTPSGRFQPGQRICLSMSDFHPHTWNPAWSVTTILQGLQSFMVTDEMAAGTVNASDWERRQLAQGCGQWNSKQRLYKELFASLDPNWGLDPSSITTTSSIDTAISTSLSSDTTTRLRLSTTLSLTNNSTTNNSNTATTTTAAASTITPISTPIPTDDTTRAPLLLLTPTKIKWIILVVALWLYLFISRVISRSLIHAV